MIAIFLCAGFATRMYPITTDFPKPLLDVGGRPVLDYLMDQVVDFPKLDSIHIVTNESFHSHFNDWEDRWDNIARDNGVNMYLHNDGATKNEDRLGAIKDLALVLNSLKKLVPSMVAAGDNIYRFRLKPIIQEFIGTNKNIVLAVEEIDHTGRRKKGVLELGYDNRVKKFHEKPEYIITNWACPPIYFLQTSALGYVLDYINRSDAGDAPGHFVSYLVEREPVYAIKVNGKRIDIGSVESYREANRILSREPVILE